MSQEPKLRDWDSAEARGTRFPLSERACPECGEMMREDNWPPNYGGSSSGGGFWEESGSIKYVCISCRMTYRISYQRRGHYPPPQPLVIVDEEKEVVSEGVPLVEHDGHLLTPHDVWREEYRTEHGEYPPEVYA